MIASTSGPGVAQLVGERQQWLALDVGHRQPRALAREEHSARPADAERGAGDHRRFSCKSS